MSEEPRQYDLVILGATGYTGQLTAEYIQEHVATNLKWAIAGRNAAKLSQVAQELKTLNSNRRQPAIEILELNSEDLLQLAHKTKVLISTIGPFCKYGEPVVKACVQGKTHYFDICGETPFTFDMLHKYHEEAEKKDVIIAPHSGVDSIPADILSFLCVKKIRETYNVGVKDCTNVIYELGGGPSAGSLATILSLMEEYPSHFTKKALQPYALSPIPPPGSVATASFLSKILGWRNIQHLGILMNDPQAECDIGIVNRSWGLHQDGKYYGSNFHFNEYKFIGSRFKAFVIYYVVASVRAILRIFPLSRRLFKSLLPSSGQGPPKEEFPNYRAIFKTIATADCEPERKVIGILQYTGSPYYLTGVLVVQAALTLLTGSNSLAKTLKGMVTPATWGMELVGRIKEAGVSIEIRSLEE